MGLGRKKTADTGRRRRVATNTVAEATPSRNVYNRRGDAAPEPRRKASQPSKKSAFAMFMAKASSALLILACLFAGAYMLSLSSSPLVKSLDNTPTAIKVHDPTEYAAAAKDILSSSLWNKSKLTIHTKDIESQLEKKFPELDNVTVVVPFFGSQPVIYYQPSHPALVLSAANGTYILNKDGRVLIMQDNLPPVNKLGGIPVVTDQSSLKADLGKQVLTKNNVRFIRIVLAQLKAGKVKYDSVVLPAGSSELDIHIVGKPYFVKFNLQDVKNASQQAGTFLAVYKEFNAKHITPSKYIDVRLEGRAYYK